MTSRSFKAPRIAILSIHSCPKGDLGTRDTGGMSVYIREVAVKLSHLGYKVDVFTRKHSPGDREVIELVPGARLIHLKAGEERQNIDKIALYFHLDEFVEGLENYRLVNGTGYDLIFSHYWLSGMAGQMLAEKWRVPHAVMFHTLSAVKNRLGVGEPEPDLREAGEKEVVRNCDLIVVSTAVEKRDVITLYGALPGLIKVIAPGVNLELFKPVNGASVVNNGKRVIYVGRIDPLKGLDRLLLALREISGDIECQIIGGGDSSQEEISRLEHKIRQYGLKNVRFIGLVEQSELPLYYSGANVLALPSYYESFGLVALEAMACGCPVVSTAVGDLPAIIKRGINGHVVEPFTVGGFSTALSHWLESPARTRRQNLEIRSSVAGFEWKKVASRLDAEFKNLIARGCRVS